MRLAVLGATGATGKQVVEQALAAGHSVTAVVRKPADVATKHAALTVVEAQATKTDDLARALAGHDAVISCIGARTRSKNTVRSDSMRALIAAMTQLGLKRVVWISSAGVGDSADLARRSSFIFGSIIMPLMLKASFADCLVAEELLRASPLEWVVVRPMALTNGALSPEVTVVPLDAAKAPRLAISRASVARFMIEAATGNAYVRQMPVIC